MRSWYRNDRLRIAAMTLVAGLLVGLLVTYAAGLGTSGPELGAPDDSVAAAIASDRPPSATVHRTQAPRMPFSLKAKAERAAVERPDRSVRRAPAGTPNASAPAATPATPPDPQVVEAGGETRAPTPVAAAPRRRRATAERHTTIPLKTSRPEPAPKPAPSPAPIATTAPATSKPAPAPGPPSAAHPTRTPRPPAGHGNGNGNGNGGVDDPGNRG